jgi:hypothetical protein
VGDGAGEGAVVRVDDDDVVALDGGFAAGAVALALAPLVAVPRLLLLPITVTGLTVWVGCGLTLW